MEKTETGTTHLGTVQAFVRFGRPEIGHPVSTVIRFSRTSEEATIRRYGDGKWRYTYHKTYGNGSFINGEGCDASGYVIRDAALIQRLEEMLSDPRLPQSREMS